MKKKMKDRKQSYKFCVICADDRELAVETKSVNFEVRGETVSVELPITTCSECGTEEVDEEFGKDPTICAYDVYRERHKLLSSEAIKSIRERYQLSQKSFAFLVGMSESSVNRYEAGVVQDATQNTAMLAFEDAAFVEEAVARRGHHLSKRQREKVLEAVARVRATEVSTTEVAVSQSWIGALAEKVSKYQGAQSLVQSTRTTWGSAAIS